MALAAWAGEDENPWSVLPRRELAARGTDMRPPPGTPHQFSWAREEDIAAALEAGGFTEHQIEALDFTIDYRSAADWWRSQSELSTQFAAMAAAASDDDLAAVGDALDRHAERFAAEGGTLRVPARTWVAWASA